MNSMTWPPTLPFEAVLARARTLDNTAISLLYRRFLPVVYRYALARVSDVHHAEDITADTFFAMVEGIGGSRAQDELAFVAWVLGIARNKVALHYRRHYGRSEVQGDLPEEHQPFATADGGDPLTIITARESWSDVVRALQQLTDEQRTVVLYRCVLGYSAEDVGRLLNKQAGSIRALQFRALATLARILGVETDQGQRPSHVSASASPAYHRDAQPSGLPDATRNAQHHQRRQGDARRG